MCYLNTMAHQHWVTHRTVGHHALLARDVGLFTNMFTFQEGKVSDIQCLFLVGTNHADCFVTFPIILQN